MKKAIKGILASTFAGLIVGVLLVLIFHANDSLYGNADLNKAYNMPFIFWRIIVPLIIVICTMISPILSIFIIGLISLIKKKTLIQTSVLLKGIGIYILLLIVTILGFYIYSQSSALHAFYSDFYKVPDNTLPKYGTAKKLDKQVKSDSLFVSSAIATAGTKDKAYDAAIRRGWEYFYRDNYDTSTMRFNQAWLIDSTRFESYWGFSQVVARRQKYDDAIEYLLQCLEIEKSNDAVYNDIAFAYFRRSELNADSIDFNTGRIYLNKGYLLNPNNPAILSQLAIANYYLKQYKKAYEYLLKAEAIDPSLINPMFKKQVEAQL